MSVKIVFEIGHIASPKSKITPEGFTHDWELYVRGSDSADISHYIEKVVFNLHESFPKPKRGKKFHCTAEFRFSYKNHFYFAVFKEPPYCLKESGYAGFVLPIDIYFKNRDDPKKITYSYDLNLQNTGTITNVEKKTQLFKMPSEDFRRKLLKGGGALVNNFPNNSDEKAREQEERSQLISKPKLGGSELSGKKYKSKADESKVSNTYNLFASTASKGTAKVSPDAKTKSASNTGAKQPQKTEKTSRDKSEKDKKEKNKHNSPNKEKADGRDASRKAHEDKHEKREEKKKDKTHSKERGRSKDKVSNAKQDPSPKRMPPSPKRVSPSRSASALSKTDDTQSAVTKNFSKQAEPNDRPSSSAKKPKKDKKEKNPEKERDRERTKDQKQKEERPSSKVSDKIDLKKEKDTGNRNQKDKTKVNDVKQSNPVDHANEASTSTPNEKKSEKDPDRKHKHKKKDKNKDKEKEHSKERKKEKSSKYKEDVKMANTSPPKKSEQPQSSQLPQQQTKVNPLTTLLNEIEEKASSDSDDDHSKPSISYTQAIPSKMTDNAPKPVEDSQPTKSEKQLEKSEKPAKRAKKEKEAKNSDKEDKKRKRKSKDETPSPAFSEPPIKQSKKDENGALSWRSDISATFMSTPPPHRIDSISRSSPLPTIQKSTPSRSSSLRATPSPLSTSTTHHQLSPNLQQQQQRQQKDYMSQLKELQHKIMSLEDNNELQQVVEMIIETGNYEITGDKTFDFDLCTLDRTTVQRLQTFFATSCWL